MSGEFSERVRLYLESLEAAEGNVDAQREPSVKDQTLSGSQAERRPSMGVLKYIHQFLGLFPSRVGD